MITGFAGSLMMIAVNGWMNHPTGFTLRAGEVVDVHPFAALFENDYTYYTLRPCVLARAGRALVP